MTRQVLSLLTVSLVINISGTVKSQTNQDNGRKPARDTTVHERVIGQLKTGYAKGSLAFSPDGTRLAYVTGPQGSQRMVCGDSVGPPVVFCSVPRFSPETNRLYYCAIKRFVSRQLKVYLVAGDKTIPTDFTPGAGTFFFSPDGCRWAAIGGKIDQEGQTVKPGGVTVIVDGKTIGTYRDISSPVFSNDGKKCAFAVLNKDDTISILVDSQISRTFKKPQVPCSFIFNTSVSGPNLYGMVKLGFLPDGRIACLIRDEQGWSIYIGEQQLATYRLVIWGGPNGPVHTLTYDGSDKDPAIMANSFVVAKNAATVAWWSRSGGKETAWQVLLNGEAADEFGWHDDIQRYPPVLSPDGKHIAYYAMMKKAGGERDAYHVIHDGRKLGPYGNVWALAISADGNHVAFAAQPVGEEESWHCYVDGKQIGTEYTSLYATAFCGDGSQVCWAAKRDGKGYAVVNGTVIASGDSIVYGPICGENKSPRWVLRRGDDLIEISPEPK